jgi:hypothetical protein
VYIEPDDGLKVNRYEKILSLLGAVSLTATIPAPLMAMKNIKITTKEELPKVKKAIARKTAARAAREEIRATGVRIEAAARAAREEIRASGVRIEAAANQTFTEASSSRADELDILVRKMTLVFTKNI